MPQREKAAEPEDGATITAGSRQDDRLPECGLIRLRAPNLDGRILDALAPGMGALELDVTDVQCDDL